MSYVLFFGALLMVMVLVWLPLSPYRPNASVGAYRNAFLLSVGLMSAVWYLFYTTHSAPSYAFLSPIAGALLGGITATAIDIGLVHNAAPPSAGVRKKLPAHHTAENPHQPLAKRLFDITGALICLVVTLPLWPVIAAFIWIEQPGPIIVKNSTGADGATSRRPKFRTTRYEPDHWTNPTTSSGSHPGTLKVGRLLRHWRLDDPPELINVVTRTTASLVLPGSVRDERRAVSLDDPARIAS